MRLFWSQSGVGELLRAIDGYEGQPITLDCHAAIPYAIRSPRRTAPRRMGRNRSGGCGLAHSGSKMKGRQEHVVPLSQQAIALLREAGGAVRRRQHMCSLRCARQPNPMSENTINAGLRRLGFAGDEMTAHGFRAMASTLLNESGKWSSDAIERALAHKDKDAVRAAYHRGALLGRACGNGAVVGGLSWILFVTGAIVVSDWNLVLSSQGEIDFRLARRFSFLTSGGSQSPWVQPLLCIGWPSMTNLKVYATEGGGPTILSGGGEFICLPARGSG